MVAYAVLDKVAAVTAARWRRRGLPADSDDVYQDAAEVCLTHAEKYDGRGTVEGFLISCAMQKSQDRATRLWCPAGTRSNSEVKNLQTVTRVSSDIDTPCHTDMDTCVFLKQVRDRLEAVARDHGCEEALPIVFKIATPAMMTDCKTERIRLYRLADKLRRYLRADKCLSKMADSL